MRWLQLEYILKGVYVGLLLFVAMQSPSWADVEMVGWCVGGGLAAALALAGFGKVKAGYSLKGRWLPFVLFLLLESPGLVYAGILLGMAAGAWFIMQPGKEPMLAAMVAGGAMLGLLFWIVRHVRRQWTRFGIVAAMAIAIPGGLLYWLQLDPTLLADQEMARLGTHLLLGIPFFYLLTFAGRAEESEVEIGVMCAALGAGLYLVNLTPNLRTIPLLLPLALFYVYTARILPRLRVFKHAMRGHSYANVGQYRQALLAFRRAVELEPNNKLAREGIWSVHRSMDVSQIARDPEMLALVDVNVCLQRAASLLVQGKPPTAKALEANHLLDLVLSQQPGKKPIVHYWRAVGHLHQAAHDRAAEELNAVLDPKDYSAKDADRRSILFQAWQLALLLHPEMQRRVGGPQLAEPGRRMEAIAAVERHLAGNPEDTGAWDMKRLLYAHLTEADYDAAVGPDKAAADFDHGYAQQLGLALINDSSRWTRGAEFLRLAARGLAAVGPSIFTQIAQAQQRAGNADEAMQTYESAIRAGRAVGPKNLGAEDQQAYFGAIKLLAETAAAKGDLETAIENYHLYTENERSGIETLRTLAALYEKKGDPLSALRIVEIALVYNGKDKDLRERKDKYYYSVMPEHLKPRLEAVRNVFDVAYCLGKAQSILASKTDDPEMLDWGLHLAELAQIVEPSNITAMVLRSRLRLLRGERDEALVILEDLREQKPEKFASDDDQEAWYLANRILGNLYLNELSRPDLAIYCFNEFRQSSKSGADTLYRLGQAYEATGDLAKAKRFYELVTGYDGHPLAPEAREALYRLQSPTA